MNERRSVLIKLRFLTPVVFTLLVAGCAGRNGAARPLTVQAAPAQRVIPAAAPAGAGEEALIQRGEQLYSVNCAPCHQRNGEGNLHRFPALNGNAFVTAQQPQPLIQTVLYGRAVMPSFAPTLSDAELAAVLSYVRNARSNGASLVNAEQVSQVRRTTTPTPDITGEETGQFAQ